MATRAAHRARTIVVGTDFSRPAARAVARAIQLAATSRATLHIVHASRSLPRALARAFGAADDRTIRDALRAAVDEARSAGIHARSHHVNAGATRGLSRSVSELRPAVAVVGARGHSIRDAFVGSTAERLAMFGRCPVLLVRRSAARPYREVVIAADVDSELADGVAAANLITTSAPCSVLHAYEGAYEYRLMLDGAGPAPMRMYRAQTRRDAQARMSKALRAAGMDEALLQLQHGSAPRVLQRVDANALLVLNRHRSLTRHVLLGSTTRFVIAYGTSDVLIV